MRWNYIEPSAKGMVRHIGKIIATYAAKAVALPHALHIASLVDGRLRNHAFSAEGATAHSLGQSEQNEVKRPTPQDPAPPKSSAESAEESSSPKHASFVYNENGKRNRWSMIATIETKYSELADLCQRYHVKQLELFGSAADDTFDPDRSDFDFLVEFEPCNPSDHYERYFGLVESLEALLERPVDLVETHVITNPYFFAPSE